MIFAFPRRFVKARNDDDVSEGKTLYLMDEFIPMKLNNGVPKCYSTRLNIFRVERSEATLRPTTGS